ncbi:hypothetical protein PspLS_00643 [Pyricularia sp. CBS 133598]|nr:hypothetical protein PspLS_00643 [Pyricularia sp. CBS 133598]
MSERSCPVSGSLGGKCPGARAAGGRFQLRGPRGCSFSGYSQPGDLYAAFDIPRGVDAEEWLRLRERKTINEVLYSNIPAPSILNATKNIDTLTASDHDLLAVALGAPARQVIIRAEEVGPRSGWRDGFLTAEYGFVPHDPDMSPAALAASPGRIWSDLCERMPGCVARGRVRESVAALPVIEATEDIIPDDALWAACVVLGMLCSIYRYEENNDGSEGVNTSAASSRSPVEMSDDVVEELKGIPRSIGLPYFQVSKRLGRAIPHLSFPDQSSYNIKLRDPRSVYPYRDRFDNIDLRWPVFGERTEIAFLKGCADTSASFQHGPDAIASCQEHVMSRNVEGLLRELIRLKEIIERMPNAFHSISPNPSSGENFVSAEEWVRWGQFSKPLSKRCAAASGLQFPPYLLMDAFLGRKKYRSFLGAEGVHLRAWQPANLRAFIAAVEYHYSVPEFVERSGDPRLIGVLDGIVEAYCGERGFMGVHRYKVYGILEVAAKTGRSETNGASGAADGLKPWEETHKQFSEAMKERLEPYRGDIPEPNQMRGTFEECRYRAKILSRASVDNDPNRTIAGVTLDIQNTGITFQPGDRLAVMPLNSWEECAKVAAALGLDENLLEAPVELNQKWTRFLGHLKSVSRATSTAVPQLTVKDILRRGHLAPLTKELVLKVHAMLRASSTTVLQVLATDEWPVRGSLGDLLQAAVLETPELVWDQAFDLQGDFTWLADLVPVEVPRTYSISNYPDELLPSTVDLTISRSEYLLSSIFANSDRITRAGVSSGFLNPMVTAHDEMLLPIDEDVLVGVSRPVAFQLPLDGAAPCAFFAGGSGIAPFRSFWQARVGNSVGRNILYLGVQSREKFCYENELRQYVSSGQMEVHLAFSRDSRGLAYDPQARDLVEKKMPPRYINDLIIEEGSTVCDLVMSKKQGGLGGYLYVCGSVSVFESVMSGIKKAIYYHRTATMENADVIVNTAFAERRFMLDVFMTPKPLPCDQPTIPLSQLALNTGHRPGQRMWIGVHGSVYDVTDFCPMHPGGTLIIRSNAGVDCSKSFDSLGHTNNPEVSSLLTKYFVGHLTPRPDFQGNDDIGSLYDLWADYLRTSVETLVAQSFEMNIMVGEKQDSPIDPTMVWSQGNLFSMKGVRMFYKFQSRLLQNGFSSLFGPKFQELVLKLSFSLANSSAAGPVPRLPDVLGVIARAKTSEDAVATSKELSAIGHFINDSEGARFHEQGIINYATQAIELDVSLLEDIRREACHGFDAFGALSTLQGTTSEAETAVALSTFLMQVLERMAKRLEMFYERLSKLSVYKPEIEKNPARTRWHLVRQRISDGSFFVLTQEMSVTAATQLFQPRGQLTVDFDHIISQVRHTLNVKGAAHHTQPPQQYHQKQTMTPATTPPPLMQTPTLNSMHQSRSQTPADGASAFESYENRNALNRMSTFMDRNMRAIRRLSRVPIIPSHVDISKQQHHLHNLHHEIPLDTPPRSRSPSRARIGSPVQLVCSPDLAYASALLAERRLLAANQGRASQPGLGISGSKPQLPPLVTGASAMAALMGKMNVRGRSPASSGAGSSHSRQLSAGAVSLHGGSPGARTGRSRTAGSMSGGSLRTFKLAR